MDFYRRNLPHWQPPKAKYFITFRLAGSLPAKKVRKIKSLQKELTQQSELGDGKSTTQINRKIFQKYEQLLEQGTRNRYWLRQKNIATLVCEAIEYRNGKQYDLYAYCIMPNHVHIAFKLLQSEGIERPVTKILQSLKQFTAKKANKILNRSGQFW